MQQFNFWKDNRTDEHFQLTEKEIIAHFNEWIATKEIPWLVYYNMNAIVCSFISEKLKAVGNSDNNWEEINELEILLKPFRWLYIDSKKSIVK